MPEDDRLEDTPSRDTDPVRLGAELDDVRLVSYTNPWPIPATRAERRARRQVLTWFGLSVLSGLAFIGCYLFWPSDYVPPGEPGHDWYVLNTPALGLTLGTTLLGIFVGLVLYVKRFMPRELAIQQRHDEPSAEIDQQTATAILNDAADQARMKRRTWMGRAVGAAAGMAGLGTGLAVVGSFVKSPWIRPESPESLWHTAWAQVNGEKVYLRMDVSDPHRVVLVQPGDLAPGSMVTVIPFTGRMLGERLGKLHFWMTFHRFPHHVRGAAPAGYTRHATRRYADYLPTDGFSTLNLVSSAGAFLLGASMLPFLWNIFASYRYGRRNEADDSWGFGNSLEWATTSPPPRHNFHTMPKIRSVRPAFDLHHGHKQVDPSSAKGSP